MLSVRKLAQIDLPVIESSRILFRMRGTWIVGPLHESLSMKIVFCLLASLFLLICSIPVSQAQDASEKEPWCTYLPDAQQNNGKKIVLISGDEEYRSEEALPMLGKILAKHHGYTCTVLFPVNPETGEIDPNNQQNIPGMNHLEDADLVIMALRFRCLPDDQMKYFDSYLMSGRPIIGLRTSTHAFRFPGDFETSFRRYSGSSEWPGGFGKQVLGETWVNHHGHHGRESTRGVVNPAAADNILLQGVEDVWGPTDVYGIRELPEGTTVLLMGQVLAGMNPDDPALEGAKNDPMMPLAWTRTWTNSQGGENSIFCTTMGSSTDFESEDLRRLIVNAALQMTGLEKQISPATNVNYVGEFKPTKFGFNAFQKGTTPRTYDMPNP